MLREKAVRGELRRAPETFPEADCRYAELKRRYDAGIINNEEFDTQLKQLMVQDPEGRWWAKSRKTGEWHYNDGNTWVQGTPPNS